MIVTVSDELAILNPFYLLEPGRVYQSLVELPQWKIQRP